MDNIENTQGMQDNSSSHNQQEKQALIFKKEGASVNKKAFLKDLLKDCPADIKNELINAKKTLDDDNNTSNKIKLSDTYIALQKYILTKTINSKLRYSQLLCIRFNLLDLDYISDRQFEIIREMTMISKELKHNPYDIYSVFYIDEWFNAVKSGRIRNSITDEVYKERISSPDIINSKLDDKMDKKESELAFIGKAITDIEKEENTLQDLIKTLMHVKSDKAHPNTKSNLLKTYGTDRKKEVISILRSCKKLIRKDNELKKSYKIFTRLEEELSELKDLKLNDGKAIKTKISILKQEYVTTKKMIKLCVGVQGNRFPILMNKYFSEDIRNCATKENILKLIEAFENIDYTIFVRKYRGMKNRVFPHIILLPCYGTKAICWESVPRNNRAIGQSTLAVPMFPKSLEIALLSGFADLRWESEKQHAGQHWMSEGLTGNYYTYFLSTKVKANVKDYFITDYITWMMYESNGRLKLNKGVRDIFWFFIPFNEKIKEELCEKSYVYSELYIKEKIKEQSRNV